MPCGLHPVKESLPLVETVHRFMAGIVTCMCCTLVTRVVKTSALLFHNSSRNVCSILHPIAQTLSHDSDVYVCS